MNTIRLTLMATAVALLPASMSVMASGSITLEPQTMVLDVHKSPTCGCCSGWVEHMAKHGFETKVHHPADLMAVKNQAGIPANARSCHTAVSANGYVFEGHIPAKFVEKFLANPPAGAKGLIVPAMPVGSPGMEYNHQFMPYTVLQLNNDGSLSHYADVRSADEQV